jgi:hypothetical protein
MYMVGSKIIGGIYLGMFVYYLDNERDSGVVRWTLQKLLLGKEEKERKTEGGMFTSCGDRKTPRMLR